MPTKAVRTTLSILTALFFSQTSPAAPSQSEALVFAKSLVASRVISCSGRSFFWGKGSMGSGERTYLAEVKEPALSVAADKVSDAEKLNGLDYKGLAILRFKAIRLLAPDRKEWSEWSTLGFSSGESFAFAVVHEKNGWKHRPGDLVKDFLDSHESKPIACNNVPKQ